MGQRLDARSDIFSFGMVLYELLAGHLPFHASVAMLHPLGQRRFPALPSEVPAQLRAIVDKALEVDPADRYQTMRDLVVDLRKVARRNEEPLTRVPANLGWRVVASGAAVIILIGLAWLATTFRRVLRGCSAGPFAGGVAAEVARAGRRRCRDRSRSRRHHHHAHRSD